MDLVGHHSNPILSSSTPGQSEFSATVNSRREPTKGGPGGTDSETGRWFNIAGQLSNPASSFNQIVDVLLRGLEAMGFVLGQPSSVVPRQKRKVVRQLTVAQVDEIVQLYRGGNSAPVLARKFGVHRTTVLLHLERRGVPRRVNKRKLTDEKVEEMRHLYRLGVSYNELARRYGVSGDTVRKELSSH